MNPMPTPMTPAAHAAPVPSGPLSTVVALIDRVHRAFAAIPESLIALLSRFSIAAVFWLSGQTKVEGFAINLVDGTWQLGWPHLSGSAVDLFRDEYKLPLLDPTVAAVLGATAEHVLPTLLLLGFATRLSAFGLLGMTLVIQTLVYPGAYPTHGTWAALLLWLMLRGPGRWSVDAWLARHAR